MSETAVALLVTDLVGSTALAETLGDARVAEVFAAHDDRARDLLVAHDGREIDKTDGFLLLFDDPVAAARYALDYHAALAALSDDLGVILEARAGLHVGSVVLRTNPEEQVRRGAKALEVEGVAKPTCARVMSVARGGQTLATPEAVAALGVDGLETRSHGHFRLKGVAEPIELFEVGAGDRWLEPPADTPKVHRVVREESGGWRPARDIPAELPSSAGRFFGRSEQLSTIAELLEAGRPLVTITGDPGSGRTRLATRYARSWLGSWPGGARLLGPEDVDSIVAADGRLIILDDATADAADVACRVVQGRGAVLATARRPLGVPGEAVVHAGPLALGAGRAAVRMLADRLRCAPDAPGLVRLADALCGHPADIERAASRRLSPGRERPFRGLSSFGTEDADLFFGRDAESRRLAERLRTESIVTVTGASGTGKTSLLAAGVRAHLPDRRFVVMRPGTDPGAALLGALRRLGDGPAVLVVDQAEELLTLTGDAAARETFAQQIVELARTPDVSIALAVREDFFGPLATIEAFAGRYTACVEVLTRPSVEALRETLVRPAALFGHLFEDEALLDEMVDAAAGRPASLALLQFCADQLWERRDRDRHLLTRAAFHDIGGVEGALARHADSVLASLSTSDRAEARRQFLRLVTIEHTREPRARTELVESGRDPSRASGVLDRLIGARLLAVSEAEDGAPRIEVVHEALIGHWDRLTEWLAEDLEGQRMTRALGLAAAEWAQRGEDPGLLWRGDALLRLGVWLRDGDRSLTELERRFADVSQRHARRARRNRRIAVGVALAVLSAISVVALTLWQRAERIAHDAQIGRQIAVAQRERARGHSPTAARLARAALTLDPSAADARTVLADRVVTTDATLQLRTETTDNWAPWSPDLTRFVVYEDGNAWLLDASGARIASLPADPDLWRIARWAPDSRHLLVRDRTTATLVDRDGAPVVAAPAARAGNIHWADDGGTVKIIVSGAGGESESLVLSTDPAVAPTREPDTVCMHQTSASGATLLGLHDQPAQLRDPSGALVPGPEVVGKHWKAALSPDGSRAAVAARLPRGEVSPLTIWGPDQPPITVVDPPIHQNASLRWDPTGAWLLVLADLQPPHRIAATGEELRLPDGFCALTEAVAWDSSGRLAVGCQAGQVIVYDPQLAELARWYPEPAAVGRDGLGPTVRKIGWSPDGQTIATADDLGNVRLSPALGRAQAPFGASADTEVGICTFAPGGGHVAALTMDGRVLVWDREGAPVATVPVDQSRVVPLFAWHPDSARFGIALGSSVHLHDLASGGVQEIDPGLGVVEAFTWREDGRLALIGQEGGVLLSSDGTRSVLGDFDGTRSRSALIASWSPDGERLLLARDEGEAWLWDARGTLIAQPENDRILSAFWHPSSHRFHLSGAPWEQEVQVLSRDGETLWRRPGVVTGPWDPAGERWIVSLEKEAHLANAEDGAVLRLMPHPVWVFQTEWSPDGAFVHTRHLDGTQTIWDRDGQKTLDLHAGGSGGIGCFDPRAPRLLGPDSSGGLRAWPLTDAALLDAAEAMFPQGLSLAERDLLR